MNRAERIKMVKAMEFICRQVNDEDNIGAWLTLGVADGDIEYGDLTVTWEDDESGDFDYYIEDDEFGDLMDTFLFTMKKCWKSGGLCCDGVVSRKVG